MIRAFDCFENGASRGDPNAMKQLGLCYRDGLGVPKDAEKAEHWTSRAETEASNTVGAKLSRLQSSH
jgi:TPR repeat protein